MDKKLNFEELKELVFNLEEATKQNKDKLFKLAKSNQDIEVIQQLADEFSFKNAKKYIEKITNLTLKDVLKSRDVNMLQVLLTKSIDISTVNIAQLIFEKYHTDFIKYLIIKGADLTYKYNKKTVLFSACESDNLEILKYLINIGENINDSIEEGWTPLLCSVSKRNKKLVKFFIKHNANINHQLNDGASALMIASSIGDIDIVKYLIDKDIDVSLKLKNGDTALDVAIVNKQEKIFEFLLSKSKNNFSFIAEFTQKVFHELDTKITNISIAKQFVLEEIEACFEANEETKRFALSSGFDITEYIGAMDNSFYEVDGIGGPQQFLLWKLMSLGLDDIDLIMNIRIRILDRVMRKYSLGKYQIKSNSILELKSTFPLKSDIKLKFHDTYLICIDKEIELKYKKDTEYKYINDNNYIEINNNEVLEYKNGKRFFYEISSPPEQLNPLVITEGKTDWKHLKKVLNKFQNKGFYTNLNIDFLEYENINMGDSELDTMVRTYAKVEQNRRYIFMFDRDNNKYVNTYAKKEFNNHENNIYSFCIPKINDELDRICIEFYYKKEDLLTKDEDGKRIFLGNEFYPNGNSKCGQYVSEKRKAKELDILDRDKKVYLRDDIEWKNNIALSKNDFTNNIIMDVKGFDNFDIEYFRLIFDVIEKIVKD